jgi:hypothetical protein
VQQQPTKLKSISEIKNQTKKMTWQDISIEQYQKIASAMRQENFDDFDKEIAVIASLTGRSQEEILAGNMEDFNKLRVEYQFLHTGKFEGNAVKRITVNNKQYEVQYDLKILPIARYVEFKHFTRKGQDFVNNLHLILASITKPVDGVYDASRHSDYANEMKKAKFIDCYHTGVFFCELLSGTILNMRVYLEQEIMKTNKVNRRTVQAILTALEKNLAGYTM